MARPASDAVPATKLTAPDDSERAITRELVWLGVLLTATFLVSLLLALDGLSLGWDQTLLGPHAFRQTQTAIGVRSILAGGPWVLYETPVLGPPWSIPFEFPFYQWCVAIVHKTTGAALDQSGRATSVAFFLASAALGFRVLGQLGIQAQHRAAFLALLLASPLYIFWSRAFLIESTVLFLCLVYLSLALSVLEKPEPLNLLLAGVVGALAATVKFTTFWGFLLVVALVVASRLWKLRAKWRAQGRSLIIERAFTAAAAAVFGALIVAPITATIAWTWFADQVKLQNPLARGFLDSASLTGWLYGDLSQRQSAMFWYEILTGAQVRDVLGSRHVLPLLLVAALFSRERRALIWGSLLAFIAVPLTFTNLHVVHNYYAYGNGVFLLAALGFLLADLLERGSRTAWLGAGLLVLVVATQQWTYFMGPRKSQQILSSQMPEMFEKVRVLVPHDQVILVYGLDWNPSVAYYSGHRAVMDRDDRPLDSGPIAESLRLLAESGETIGGLLNCTRPGTGLRDKAAAIRRFALSAEPAFSDGFCWLYVAARRSTR